MRCVALHTACVTTKHFSFFSSNNKWISTGACLLRRQCTESLRVLVKETCTDSTLGQPSLQIGQAVMHNTPDTAQTTHRITHTAHSTHSTHKATKEKHFNGVRV